MSVRLNSILLLVGAFAASAANASLTSAVTNTVYSPVAGAHTIDFGNTSAPGNSANANAVVGSAAAGDTILQGTLAGVDYKYVDGALFNNSTLISGMAARPVGALGNYLSVGTESKQKGPSTLTFGSGLSYFGFLWGSPDSYNSVTFWNGSHLLATFNGTAVSSSANGDQSFARYFGVTASGGDVITKVVFSSGGNAFETDNHAFISAVPEPETYAMLLAGLGLMAVIARRKTSRTTRRG
jgi:hypothetical protein